MNLELLQFEQRLLLSCPDAWQLGAFVHGGRLPTCSHVGPGTIPRRFLAGETPPQFPATLGSTDLQPMYPRTRPASRQKTLPIVACWRITLNVAYALQQALTLVH